MQSDFFTFPLVQKQQKKTSPVKILIAEMSETLEEGPPWCALSDVRALGAERYTFALVTTPPLADALEARGLWAGPLHRVNMQRPRVTKDPAWWAGFLSHASGTVGAIEKIIRNERPDVVLVNSIINLYAGIAASRAHVPIIWYIHEILPQRRVNDMYIRWMAGRARRIVAVSRAVKDRLTAAGAPHDRINVVYNALPDFSISQEAVDALRARIGLAPGQACIAVVGRIHEGKGQHVMVEATAKIFRDFPGMKVIVAGKPIAESEEYNATLQRRAFELGMSDVFHFIGPQAGVFPVYAAADFLVQPSVHFDSLPRTVMEAAGVGRAVIGTRIGGIPELIRDGETGLLTPPGDVDALAGAMRAMLLDPERRRAMGRAAKEMAVEQFSEFALGQSLDQIIQEIL